MGRSSSKGAESIAVVAQFQIGPGRPEELPPIALKNFAVPYRRQGFTARIANLHLPEVVVAAQDGLSLVVDAQVVERAVA